MYPQRELSRLAGQKAALQRVIAVRRQECAAAAHRVTQPLVWLDRMLGLWRQFAPLLRIAAVPLGFVGARKLFPRLNFITKLVRWGPLIISAVRGINTALKGRDGAADA